MTLSVDVSCSSPVQLNKESPLSMAASSPLISPSSDKRFWSALRNRVETLLETRNSNIPTSISSLNNDGNIGGLSKGKRMKEDSMLLIRGFDSVAYSLSQLTSTLDTALQGARDLAKPPTLTEIVQSGISNTQKAEEDCKQDEESDKAEGNGGLKKRKIDDARRRGDEQGGGEEGTSEKEKEQKHQAENHQLKKVKNLAVSMAAKSVSLSKEVKSMKSDLCFMQERCALLEEENRRLRDGFGKGLRPEEDDLVRLQLEALLAEKSRLATENANLTRENQCLRQLVEYHQFTTQDLSASYEQVIQGLCLDFSSPTAEDPQTPRGTDRFEFRTSLGDSFDVEQELLKECSSL